MKCAAFGPGGSIYDEVLSDPTPYKRERERALVG
jgi:hypothetical protein